MKCDARPPSALRVAAGVEAKRFPRAVLRVGSAVLSLLGSTGCWHARAAATLNCPSGQVTEVEVHQNDEPVQEVNVGATVLLGLLTFGLAHRVMTTLEEGTEGEAWSRYEGCGEQVICDEHNDCETDALATDALLSRSIREHGRTLHSRECSERITSAQVDPHHWELYACGRALHCGGRVVDHYSLWDHSRELDYWCELKGEAVPARASATPGERIHELHRQLHPLPVEETTTQTLEEARAAAEARPGDDAALGALLTAYERRQEWVSARLAWRRFLAASRSPAARVRYARWLADHQMAEEGLTEARGAQKAKPPGLHLVLGQLLTDEKEYEEAECELFLATLEKPDDTEAAQSLVVVVEAYGSLPHSKLQQLRDEFAAERAH